MNITAIIVDDEELARENLSMLLEEYCPAIDIIGKAQSVETAYEKINELNPDLIFLDIRMPSGAEGFDLLAKFEDPEFLVIFVTAFKDYAIEAMNANAIHYILKPIDIDELETAVDKVLKLKEDIDTNPSVQKSYQNSLKEINRLHNTNKFSKITINHSKGIKLIDPQKISYVEAKSNCSNIYLEDGSTFLDTRTLSVYEELLPEDIFYRIHRSYIINLNILEEYRSDKGHYVILKNNIKLPVARKRVKEFIKMIKA